MSYNILIVDDSSTLRAMVRRVIGLSGVPTGSVLEAADGVAALDALGRGAVDLVLADLHMPNMGGIELTRRMMAHPTWRAIPVVIVSADPNANRMDELRRQGVKGYLAKPFTPENLRDVLGQVLGVPSHV